MCYPSVCDVRICRYAEPWARLRGWSLVAALPIPTLAEPYAEAVSRTADGSILAGYEQACGHRDPSIRRMSARLDNADGKGLPLAGSVAEGQPAESLESLRARINEFLEPHLKFPAAPDAGGDYPIAEWPYEDPAGFFEFATWAEANVFYARRTILDEEASARLLDELTEDEEDEDLEDTSQFQAVATAHRDEIVEVELGFFIGPVYHAYVRSADWVSELSPHRGEDSVQGREDWRARQREAEEARDEATPKQQEWTELLCKDKAFIAANNPVGRQAAAEAIPEMAIHLNSSRSVEEDVHASALRLAAWSALNEAGATVRSKIRPQLERQTLAELDTVAAELVARAEWDNATTKTVQKRIARDFLENRIGFTNSALTERVVEAARRKPPTSPAQQEI